MMTSTASLSESVAQFLFYKLVKKITIGRLTITDTSSGKCQVLDLGAQNQPLLTHGEPLEIINIEIKHPAFFKMTISGGLNGAAQAFMQEYWDTKQLTSLIRLLLRNRRVMDSLDSPLSKLSRRSSALTHRLRKNSITGSKKNIVAHYDLGNEFFKLFLDEHMMYSSAMYDLQGEWPTGEHLSQNLEQASIKKLKALCDVLQLQSSDHLLEIGSGWGAMAVFAAKQYGCRVTTITISDEQFAAAQALVIKNGLQARVTVLNQDYRDLNGSYDKLVSVEMVEAVGHQYLDTYFKTISLNLKPGGLAVLQAITIEDWRYKSALAEVDFIKKYIFPGSFIPAPSVLMSAAAGQNLRLQSYDDFGLSYAATLQAWRFRFENALNAVREQGFDEAFIRMWRFYLAYCEGGFRERSISVAHLCWQKPVYL